MCRFFNKKYEISEIVTPLRRLQESTMVFMSIFVSANILFDFK